MDRGKLLFEIAPGFDNPRNSEGSFISLKDGAILFVYGKFHGNSASDLAPCNIASIRSEDGGKTWSEPKELLNARDFGVTNIASISLIRLLDGGIGLLFSRPSPGQGWIRYKYFARSYDEGKTFSDFVECSSELFDCRSGVNNARLIRLSSGRLIYPHSIHPGCEKPRIEGKRKTSPTSHTLGNFIFSDDDGRSWRTSKDSIYMPFTQSNPGLQEGEIIEIKPNVLKCFFRTDKAYQYQSVSLDGGDHWSFPHPSCFTAVCSPITVRRNPYSQKIYALWNPIPKFNGQNIPAGHAARAPLAIAEMDESVSRIIKMEYVHSDTSKAYCYVAPLFLNEKEALIAFSSGDASKGEKSKDRLKIS